jgi:hypothetical protein
MAEHRLAVSEDVLQLVWGGQLRLCLDLATRMAKTSDLLAAEDDGRALGIWCTVKRRLPVGLAVTEALGSAGIAISDVADGCCLVKAHGRNLPM